MAPILSRGLEQEEKPDAERRADARGYRRQGPVAPGQELDGEHPQAERHVGSERDDDGPFGGFLDRGPGDRQERVERRRPAQREPEREEMDREKERERKARQAMQQRRDESR